VRTTDDIIRDLQKRADNGEVLRQQILSHGALARLRTDRAAAVKAGDHDLLRALDSQIRTHRGLVDEDVDERIAEQPKKDSTKLAGTAEPDPKG
jgi:hypothetical protein